MPYADKYSSRNTVASDKYSERAGYLLKEDTFYLLLESGGRIVIAGAPAHDKYSPRNT